MSGTTSGSGYTQQDPEDSASDFAARQFQINQTLARVRTMVLVKVMAIAGGAGAIAAPGTVNVQPLVKIIDGQGNVSSHGTIFNIPVFRLGGGTNAVICDPVVGDVGWMAVADRDSSVVVKTKAESQPGSRRKFDLADGVYMGSILSGVPTQYITFTETGIKMADKNGNVYEQKTGGNFFTGPVVAPDGLQIGSAGITDVGGGELSADLKTTGDVVAGTISLKTHRTTGVQTGSGISGVPTP